MISELEMEIGRTLGASCFLVYQFIKHNPGVTSNEIHIETGLSKNCVWTSLNKLKDTNVVKVREKLVGYNKNHLFSHNEEQQTWKFH